MIIVGDCCTDDTEDVVRSFEDSRITFTNLDQNSGQQAKPTNLALTLVKGEYIAFLNQDDLFFKEHLCNCVKEIQDSEAEFMVVPGIKISPSSAQELEDNSFAAEMYAVHPQGKFSPHIFSIASTWFIHRSVPEKNRGLENGEGLIHYTFAGVVIPRAYQKYSVSFSETN
jgi:glycosyltransferase involved in cell wall biosynthesis